MKTKKPYNVFTKIRSALRDIWRYSPQHRAAIKAVTILDPEKGKGFNCPICGDDWPIQLATVDHQPPCGSLTSWDDLTPWTKTLFEGSVRVICKPCHLEVTKFERRKRAKS